MASKASAALARKRERDKKRYGNSFRGRDVGKATAASEFLVTADLLKRGYEVTKPVSPTAKHDLHVDLPSLGWKGVQVKCARQSVTGKLAARGTIESPILALVYLRTNRIEYSPGTQPLPMELR